MIHHIYNAINSDPDLKEEIHNIVKNCTFICDCKPDYPELAVAVQLEEWVKMWLQCHEITCKTAHPLPDRINTTFPVVEAMFATVLTEAVDNIRESGWICLAYAFIDDVKKLGGETNGNV